MKFPPRYLAKKQIRTLDGKVYERQPTGALILVSPRKPWKGKSERRQVLKRRREARSTEGANASTTQSSSQL